ncbi:MAG: hypothetical protein IKU95_00705, partial [Clostridia bacterium]|nr:hypothetical protein [Clostridia bacterium]
MRKKIPVVLLLMLLALLTACNPPMVGKEDTASTVYFLMEGEHGRTLAYEIVQLPEGSLQQQIEAVLEAM